MTVEEFIAFVRHRRYGVVATAGPDGAPQAALVGIAVTDRGELVFDTLGTARKVANVRRDPRVAVVIGWDDEVTVQCEGRADVPTGADLDRCRAAYFEAFPDGPERAADPAIVHVRVAPRWMRHSDFRPESFGSRETTFE